MVENSQSNSCSLVVMQEVNDASSLKSESYPLLQSEDLSDSEDKENEPEDNDDDGGGWITPSNIRQVKVESADWTAPADVKVGCLTTDFAMQVSLIAAE